MGPKKNIRLRASDSQLYNYDELRALVVQNENPGATARNFELLKKTFPERFAQEMAKAKAKSVEQKTAAALARARSSWVELMSAFTATLPLDTASWPLALYASVAVLAPAIAA